MSTTAIESFPKTRLSFIDLRQRQQQHKRMPETYFITGAQGCIGSWIVKALAERGDAPVVFDRSDDRRRLEAIMQPQDLDRVRFVSGDITDVAAVRSALEASGARRIIHLAGLQVPTCKADPV